MKKFKSLIWLLCLFVPLCFAGCGETNKKLSTPQILEIKGGEIVFKSISDADYYTISINDNEFVVNPKQNEFTSVKGGVVTYDASKIFAVGNDYSIKVQANTKKSNSKFSKVYTYRYSGSVAEPTDLKINSTTLTWNAVENATYYVVKIVTPNDKIVFDKNGNNMPVVNVDTIARADLTEYSFNTNTFDFSSLLSSAGKYQFYVNAVLADGANYAESDFASPVTYTHTLQLSTPTNGKIYKVDDELHLMTILDPNANAISITCEGLEKTAEINNADKSLTKLSDNVLDVNLNKYFASFIAAENLSLENYKSYTFTTQAKFVTPFEQNSYYINSPVSNQIIFENTYTIAAPSLNIEEKDNGDFVLTWECVDSDLVSAYKILACLDTGVEEYFLESTAPNMLITENLISACIQAVGKGNYLNSKFSQFTYPKDHTEEHEFEHTIDGATITWTYVEDAYYVVILGDKYIETTDYSYTVTQDDFENKDLTVRVVCVKDGFITQETTAEFTHSIQLAAPTFAAGQGFNNPNNLYELNFTGSPNAIGYYVYIRGSNSFTYIRLNTLYTDTTIDLSHYIITEGNYTNYQIKLQAVADLNSVYTDSEQSSFVSVSHIKVLATPEFIKTNGTPTPVIKQTTGNTAQYTLQFYGVENAGSYEVLINYNRISIPHQSGKKLYTVDITNYLTAANNYEIKVRAIPETIATNIMAGEFNVTHYLISKQLPMVDNIKITENEGVFTLSFDPVDNAERYLVRIVKVNDSGYPDYLSTLGLSNYFYVNQSVNVTRYVINRGVYQFYITALAPSINSFYADANESVNYGTLSKLTTLQSPTDIGYDNISKDNYNLFWTGDDNADYYRIKLTDPNNIEYEFNAYSNGVNINQYMTVQGGYSVKIYSMVNPIGENAKEFAPSAPSAFNWKYNYSSEKDFLRYSVYSYGSNYNFVIDSANTLKNQLWYHYLYGTEVEGLSIMIKHPESTPKKAITQLSIEATQLNLYNFTGTNDFNTIVNYYDHIDKSSGDTTWYTMLAQGNATNTELLDYLCRKILLTYPEFNSLQNMDVRYVSATDSSIIFNLSYSNKFNTRKIDAPTNATSLTNYSSVYEYIDTNSRKSPTGAFAIDSRDEVLVTTTEQLLHAVQHNRKPNFVGDCSVAEEVYNNAKLVLSAIITNNMTDLEKVTAIFDWLQANYDYTYYNIDSSLYISGGIENKNIDEYGYYNLYYLEGIFQGITTDAKGNLIIKSNLATSWSYSKAFSLLCAIEGINSKVIYGTYDYYDTHLYKDYSAKYNATADHVWNKVYLSTSTNVDTRNTTEKNWYVVDLTFSDNRIYFTDLRKGYGIASHTHFLVTDAFVQDETNRDVVLTEKTYLISKSYQSDMICTSSYNYYENSSFGLTYAQIDATIQDFETDSFKVKGFNYSKQYALEPDGSPIYQRYVKTSGYGSLQAFLLNTMIYAEFMADQNPSGRSVFEFTFKHKDNGNSDIFDTTALFERFENDTTKYSIKLKLVPEMSNQFYVIKNPISQTTTVIYVVEKTA